MTSILSHKEWLRVYSICAIIFFLIWAGFYGINYYGIEVSGVLKRYSYLAVELIFVLSAILHYSLTGKERLMELEVGYRPATGQLQAGYPMAKKKPRIDDNPFNKHFK